MDVQALLDSLSETQLFGASLATIGGKLLLVMLACLVTRVLEQLMVRFVRRVLDASRVPSASIIINILRGLTWLLMLLLLLNPVFGIKPGSFMTAVGVGSVALTLCLQDTISNLIGGLSLMLSKVIEPGDVIKVGDFTGLVTDVTWRSTSLRDAYGQVNVIPNSVLSKTALVKLSALARSRCQLEVAIAHGAQLDDVRADIAELAHEVLGDRLEREAGVSVLVTGFDAAAIQATVELRLRPGTTFDEARSLLAERLVGRPWAARLA